MSPSRQQRINEHTHGCVAVQVLHCLQSVLLDLHGTPSCFDELQAQRRCNPGHFLVALQFLEGLGVLECRHGAWSCGPKHFQWQEIPYTKLAVFLHINIQGALQGTAPCTSLSDMVYWWSEGRDQFLESQILHFVDGAVVTPLIIGLLKTNLLSDSDPDPENMRVPDPTLHSAICKLFQALGLHLPSDSLHGIQLTPLGRGILNNPHLYDVVGSYFPLLQSMEDVVFGDCKTVFEALPNGEERRVDRTLNVRGSGKWHVPYFLALAEQLNGIFNNVQFSDRPEYAADMGCGDGTLLLAIYDFIRNNTDRGRILDEFPLTVIGADFTQASLQETAATLEMVPHILVQADIGNPAAFLQDLRTQYSIGPDRVMHVRSFLDHDRPFVPLGRSASGWERCAFGGTFMDAKGQIIAPRDMVQNLLEHMERWSAVVGRHGVTVLEVHLSDPIVVRERAKEFVSLSFDALGAWSSQYLLEPHVWLLCAAGAGLYCKQFVGFPPQQSITRITLCHLQRRLYHLQLAQLEDIGEMLQIATTRWDPCLCPERETLCTLISTFPQLRLLFKEGARTIAWVAAQRVANAEFRDGLSEPDVIHLGSPEGCYIQLLGIFIASGYDGVGDQIIRFALLYFSLHPRVRAVLGITQFSAFATDCGVMEAAEYLRSKRDPTVAWHAEGVAHLVRLLPGYRPLDQASGGYGIVIRYDLQTIRGLFCTAPAGAGE